jgi:cyclopropane-fatty-acyl-phospholipid synthase
MRIREHGFFKHIALYGNVGFGEAYVDGDWDTDDIVDVIAWFILNLSKTQGSRASSGKVAFVNLLNVVNRIQHLLRPNSVTTAAATSRALRPRKRLLLSLARRDDDLLRRAL